jgi:hypothetical protein
LAGAATGAINTAEAVSAMNDPVIAVAMDIQASMRSNHHD